MNIWFADENPCLLCSQTSLLPEVSFGLRVLSLPASVCVSLCVCISHLFVRVITRDPFKLGSPNLDRRCKRPWLRFLLFWEAIDLDLRGQSQLKSQNLPHFELVRTITHYPFKLGSPNLDQRCKIAWLRSLLFWMAIDLELQGQIWLKCLIFWSHYYWKYITTREPWVPRLLHMPDCFMVSILCAYLYT